MAKVIQGFNKLQRLRSNCQVFQSVYSFSQVSSECLSCLNDIVQMHFSCSHYEKHITSIQSFSVLQLCCTLKCSKGIQLLKQRSLTINRNCFLVSLMALEHLKQCWTQFIRCQMLNSGKSMMNAKIDGNMVCEAWRPSPISQPVQ